MRFLNKYKLSSRITSFVAKTPLKVIKFNRPKWEIIKKQFLRKSRYFVKNFLARVKKKSKLKARYRSLRWHIRLKTTPMLDKLKLKFSKRRLRKQIKLLKPARKLFPFEYKLKIKPRKKRLLKSKIKSKKKSKSSISLKTTKSLKSNKKKAKVIVATPKIKKVFNKFQAALNKNKKITIKPKYKYNMRIKTKSKFKLVFSLRKRYKKRRWWKMRYKKPFFKDTGLVGVPKRHPRMKRRYANKLRHERILSSLFDNSIKFQRTKLKSRKAVLGDFLIKPIYRIDILLWYLKYYGSTYEAKQNINNKKILVNDKSVKPTYFVKEGDIISLNFTPYFEKKNTYLNVRNKFIKNKNFFSFLEYDKYTNSIIIIKDLKFFEYDDYNLLITESSQLKKIQYK